MNTVDSTIQLSAADRAKLDEWCESVRAMHSLYGRPIGDGDPRLEELRKIRPNLTNLSPEELADLFWWRADFELPAWPLAVPSWSGPVNISRHNYPELTIEFIGREWLDQSRIDGTVRVGQIISVFVEDHRDDPDTELYPAGTAVTRPATVYVRVEEELTDEQAVALGEALVNAGRELATS